MTQRILAVLLCLLLWQVQLGCDDNGDGQAGADGDGDGDGDSLGDVCDAS